ncbi:MAG: peptidoglycan DD-metalloendopeptidase family protein [Leptospiraceae bacterium]|nr:peptidoglycan DD-metalloendopeptidase family protein [Leptospiraceae bacterium]MCB1302727.1 peptidoglycan DD-metalloendopeptidase family protein [Leptospiraceae bacterium]
MADQNNSMHHRRFKNRHSKHRFELQGRFSLIHLGGGSFLYSFPGKNRPIIGRVDLALGKIRNQAMGVMALSILFFGVFSLLSNSGTATTADLTEVEELKQMEGKLSPIELERKSDELKDKLLKEDHPEGEDGKVIKYTVRNGDTLSQISAKFKVPMKLIAKSNSMAVHAVLRPGQDLTIPNRPGLTYKVKKNDRIAKVAEYYSVKLDEIRKDNPDVANLDLLQPGETIFLPNAKIPAPPPVWFRPVLSHRITSGYGWRVHPLYGYRNFHSGLDLAAHYQWVSAARNGVVTYAGWMGSYGMAIIIKHDNGLKTLYGHLSRISVRVGQSVKGGQKIAISGTTGMSTGPHLHFEIIKNGQTVDPRRYMKF